MKTSVPGSGTVVADIGTMLLDDGAATAGSHELGQSDDQ
jgi:hypothetical protein